MALPMQKTFSAYIAFQHLSGCRTESDTLDHIVAIFQLKMSKFYCLIWVVPYFKRPAVIVTYTRVSAGFLWQTFLLFKLIRLVSCVNISHIDVPIAFIIMAECTQVPF